ncbi:MAG TPA: trypsin-like peptidase domain-containing protein [Acidimicrobiales bacterium]|nr:trypsin-like peptidase domain-containing protein [Acidimicrobiales bacterium]
MTGRVGRLLVALAVLALAGCSSSNDDTATGSGADAPAEPSAAVDRVPGVVQDVAPSVVVIQTGEGAGSGVVWSADGSLVTNAHVVGDRREVTVLFADGEQRRAEVVATDVFTDLALLRVDRTGLPEIARADEVPPVGTGVVAIGSPLGFQNTVSVGVISGERRSIPGSAAVTPALVDLLQTDAAISPGNSGGALVDLDGRLVGIAVAYLPPQATGAVSIGFAIPVPTVVDVIGQLAADGRAVHAFAGLQLAPVTPRMAEAFDLPAAGALVGEVVPDGPADRAGIEPGSVIVAVDGSMVRGPEDVLAAIRRADPGDELAVTLAGQGEAVDRDVTIELVERPSPDRDALPR